MGDDASQRSLGEEVRQLRAIVEELVARAGRQQQISEILASADQQPGFSQSRRKRDRHGLHIVRGLAVSALVAGGVAHWLLRARWHRVLVAGVGSVVLAGSTLAPDLMRPSAAPPASASVHRHVEHHRRAPSPQEIPVATAPRRKRRRPDLDAAAAPTPSPSPSVAPGPTPTVPDPLPSPLPTVSVPPSPTPLPTCVLLTGKHCHGGDEVAAADRALWGLAGLS